MIAHICDLCKKEIAKDSKPYELRITRIDEGNLNSNWSGKELIGKKICQKCFLKIELEVNRIIKIAEGKNK